MADRRGVTLVELLVSIVLLGLITTVALTTLGSQSRAFSVGNERLGALQNFRYTINALETDLRTIGSGVPGQQPFLVYAGEDVIAFNSNYLSHVEGDVFAVYNDPDAPPQITMSLPRSRRITIPNTSFAYPDTTYEVFGQPSEAETIIFFFVPDSTSARDDAFALYRQVNDAAPELIARNLLRRDGEPFFTYHRLVGTDTLREVPTGQLPLAHTAKIHGSPADTGRLAVIDEIRAVRVNFAATNGRTGEAERITAGSRMIQVPNAGLAVLQTCGARPIFDAAVHATVVNLAPASAKPVFAVELSWMAAVDEVSGERDVVRYVIWRRDAGTPDWGDPIYSIPSGETTYSYRDTEVTPGESYTYAVAAQDCTPAFSDLSISPTREIPFP